MKRPLLERLREAPTVNLGGDLLGAARVIRRLMIERAEAADELERMGRFVDQVAGQVVAFLEAPDPALSESDEEEAR